MGDILSCVGDKAVELGLKIAQEEIKKRINGTLDRSFGPDSAPEGKTYPMSNPEGNYVLIQSNVPGYPVGSRANYYSGIWSTHNYRGPPAAGFYTYYTNGFSWQYGFYKAFWKKC
mmetsp:Transcript_12647/g.18934  ORF Transcript_12647/g.18934 Transcript_12647/m.18934 type:complete len:115 (+) Transcript_12647:73-417(+)